MTREEAKKILSLYRPWSADAQDAEFAGALTLARQDAELGRWLEEHCAAQTTIRARLQTITPPAGLKEQILSERPKPVFVIRQRKPAVLVGAFALALALGLASYWLLQEAGDTDQPSFANYRSRMVRSSLRSYGMDLETNNATEIRSYLAQHQARADYVLPHPLAETTPTGCGVLRWQGHRVTMVCFHSGRPLPPGEKTDLFLFVMDRSAAPDAPDTRIPKIEQVNRMITASWSEGDTIYLLAAPGDETFLRKYL
jgi:hypothetical protein